MVDLTDSRGPYNLPPADPAVDELTYNPQADARIDNAEFDPEKTDPGTQPVGARGAENEPTNRDAAREDAEAARSEETGEIPESTCLLRFALGSLESWADSAVIWSCRRGGGHP